MSILREIISKKKDRLSDSKRRVSFNELRVRVSELEGCRDFEGSIRRLKNRQSLRVIAEIKRASPSAGIIREGFDLNEIAGVYRDKQVDAVSVLTEEDYFKGSIDFIRPVKEIVSCPVLRKDFIFDQYQVYEGRAYGADAILLIAAALSGAQAEELMEVAAGIGLAVLFEVHSYKELQQAIDLKCRVIGINNRDLTTLQVNISTTLQLITDMPQDRIVVSESGIRGREDAAVMDRAGVDAILVGTSLMKTNSVADMAAMIDALRG
ncbi:indole-3-glycerol-phosphate synthase [Candidatus Magnetobacterium bavaricum]|uniref:Indole-3-glycerol phosphate synthase n=1 Tax=Candidatus Magnetobacterium bavaricum TaxID=29290 RepID=A0A0F3GXU3_9BACT|nr:indole-3-glycerol-phosphate synthase [Candidatus Magnetobacterium bavaricum]